MYNSDMIALGQTRSVIRELFEYGNALAKKVGRENVFDFSLGNPSVPTPSVVDDTIKHLIDTIPNIHAYTSAQGAQNVRETVAEFLQSRCSLPVSSDHVYMTCGAAASLSICLRAAVCDEQNEVVILAPYFPEYIVFAQNAGAKVVTVPMTNTQIDIPALKSALSEKTCAVIVNSPNNPSGIVYTKDTLVALADALREAEQRYNHTILLISDEPYREIVFEDKFVSPLQFFADGVLCYSFSKTYSLPGERIGYIAVMDTLNQADTFYEGVLGAGRSLGYVCAPSLMQQTIAKCINTPSYIAPYKENRDLLVDSLTAYGFEVVNPQGAFYMLVKAPNGDAEDFSNRAKQHGILIVPTTTFGIDGYVRIATCVSKEMIERSLPHFQALAKECFEN